VDAAVVEPVDVGEGGPFDVVDVLPGTLAVDQLGLVETVEALGQGIVVAESPLLPTELTTPASASRSV
jgi:hypothetical protein